MTRRLPGRFPAPHLHVQKSSCKPQVLSFQARDPQIVCRWDEAPDFEDLLPNDPIPVYIIGNRTLKRRCAKQVESCRPENLHMLSDIPNALKLLERVHTTQLEHVDIGLLPLCECFRNGW
jgi:hypothetical protein